MAHLEWKESNGFGLVQWLRFDAVRTVEIHQTANVTRHPVQKGADVADHVRVDLPHVSLTGYISIAPLSVDAMVVRPKDVPIASGLPQPVLLPSGPIPPEQASLQNNPFQAGLLEAAINALSGLAGSGSVTSLITQNPGDRAATAATTLLRLQNEHTLVRFVDELNTYDDMVITSVVGTRTAQIYGAVFQVDLDQIRVVSTGLADLPVPAEPRAQVAKATASTPKNSGNSAVDDAMKSDALRLAQGLFHFP